MSLPRPVRSAVKMLRICSAPLRPEWVTADRAGLRSSRRTACRLGAAVEPNHRKAASMYFIRIERDPAGGLDRVSLTDDQFNFLMEVAGRSPAIAWLERHGCCPGAAARLRDCEYGQVYNIASRTAPAGAHALV